VDAFELVGILMAVVEFSLTSFILHVGVSIRYDGVVGRNGNVAVCLRTLVQKRRAPALARCVV
jgi:hypothetical protein